jgi:hypothetical protein
MVSVLGLGGSSIIGMTHSGTWMMVGHWSFAILNL